MFSPASLWTLPKAARHVDFENYANQYKNSFAVSSGGLYHGWQNYTMSYIADVVVYASYNWYPFNERMDLGASSWALNSCQRDLAGLIYKFYNDVR